MQSGQKQIVLGKGEKERRERRGKKRKRKKEEKKEKKKRKIKRVGEANRNQKAKQTNKQTGEYLLILYTLSPLTSLGLVRLAGLPGEGPVVWIYRC